MSVLHAHFLLRNQQAFQRALADSVNAITGANSSSANNNRDGTSSSGTKSWNRPSTLTAAMTPPAMDINARDWLGRTVLHLACAAIDASSAEYTRMLLTHPHIQVNLPDKESGWTALHRALYSGNLAAAVLLLQRGDTDTSAKDVEGFTPFDLYNTTLAEAKLRPTDRIGADAELFTWGTNRNAALGLADGDDRSFPDQVYIPPKEVTDVNVHETQRPIAVRFTPIHARQLAMSRLHTAVVTSEPSCNLRLCGFASGGRLGPFQHTQYSLVPLQPQHFTHTIMSVALGQDHTLALTASGEVLTWGLNRFSQLGYVVEEGIQNPASKDSRANGSKERNGTGGSASVQTTPRKVHGPLRKEFVEGVAAAKTASACWTATEVFTWGTNNGQLGYDKTAQPVQVIPRRATRITQPVVSIALTETAMAVLLSISREIICIFNDRHVKINFPNQAFPSAMQVYRPPQAIKDARIAKITSASCDASSSSNATATSTFAALSENGELFTFVVGNDRNTNEAESGSYEREKEKGFAGGIKPQRVWALRKQSSGVKDVALAADGGIVVCTESGHVFVRSRSSGAVHGGNNNIATSKSVFKFRRVPYLQRVTHVCANNTGALGALRVDYCPNAIDCSGINGIGRDLGFVVPWLTEETQTAHDNGQSVPLEESKSIVGTPEEEDEDEGEDESIQRDIENLRRLCSLLLVDSKLRKTSTDRTGIFDNTPTSALKYGADIFVQVRGGAVFPAHKVILAARSSVLAGVLESKRQVSKDGITISAAKATSVSTPSRIIITGCQPLSVLLMLTYLYTDEVPAAWDRRVYGPVTNNSLISTSIVPADLRTDLQRIANTLELPNLAYAVEAYVKRSVEPSLSRDLQLLFDSTISIAKDSKLASDVVILLADKDVRCHSLMLRARSPFFAGFFDDPEWTRNRRDNDGVVTVQFGHMRWQAFRFAMRFMCFGEGEEMFEVLDFVQSVDELLEFMFEVMAVANELLLSPLVLICSQILLTHTNLHTACFILTDAVHLHALSLVAAVMEYMAANLEALLESRMLDDLAPSIVKQLAAFVRSRQLDWAPKVRSGVLVKEAMERQAEWLETIDVPGIVVPSNPTAKRRGKKTSLVSGSPGIDVTKTASPIRSRASVVSAKSPQLLPTRESNDDIFAMDDDVAVSVPPLELSAPRAAALVWKPVSAGARVDMKTVIAETEQQRSVPSNSNAVNFRNTPPVSNELWATQRKISTPSLSRASGSPWRVTTTPTPVSSTVMQDSMFPTVGASSSRPRTSHTPPRTQATNSLQTQNTRKTSLAGQDALATQNRSLPQAPGLGPVFSPSRPAPSSSSRRVSSRNTTPSSSTKAWKRPTIPATTPTSPVANLVTAMPTPTSGISLVAIQHEQLSATAPNTDRRSLRDIQAEEQAQREEQAFMKWWAEEEERVRVEEARVLAAVQSQSQQRKGGNPSRSKGKNNGVKKSTQNVNTPPTTTRKGSGVKKAKKSE